ncbi:MAG: hypothetical protein U1F56_09895 [Rubrivivax sp.]
MLWLKLTLVPLFLLGVSLVARRWGPRVAGLFAGLPLVTGPILGFMAVEQGTTFGAAGARAALGGVAGAVTFALVYSHRALRGPWPQALSLALTAWAALALLLQLLPGALAVQAALALGALALAPRLRPALPALPPAAPVGAGGLALRMAAGAGLTLAVTGAAAWLGPRWSGVLAVFPLLSTVIAVDVQRRQGAAHAAVLLCSMLPAFNAFSAFCAVLALGYAQGWLGAAIALAVAVALGVQLVTVRLLRR